MLSQPITRGLTWGLSGSSLLTYMSALASLAFIPQDQMGAWAESFLLTQNSLGSPH